MNKNLKIKFFSYTEKPLQCKTDHNKITSDLLKDDKDKGEYR